MMMMLDEDEDENEDEDDDYYYYYAANDNGDFPLTLTGEQALDCKQTKTNTTCPMQYVFGQLSQASF